VDDCAIRLFGVLGLLIAHEKLIENACLNRFPVGRTLQVRQDWRRRSDWQNGALKECALHPL